MPGLGGRGAAGAGATSAGLEAAAALDFGAAALRGVGFAFLAADFFGALFLAAECFFFRDRATLFAFFVFLVFDFASRRAASKRSMSRMKRRPLPRRRASALLLPAQSKHLHPKPLPPAIGFPLRHRSPLVRSIAPVGRRP